MSSDLYNYGELSDSDDQSSDSDAEVEQNNKRRKKGSSPNLEDFLPSEKRAKYNKNYGNSFAGRSLALLGKTGTGIGGGASQEGQEQEEDPDSDLEILREEAAEQARKAQKEQLRRELLNAKKREKGSRAAAAAQPADAWKDRQLVARSRAWLNKKSDKEADDDDDNEVVLGDSSDEDSPYKNNNRRNQQQHPSTTPLEGEEDIKSPGFTAAMPSSSKDTIEINVQDKFGHVIRIRGWLPSAGAQCRFIFDGEVLKETDTPAGLDLEEGDQIEVHYL